ncbi:hypothetical protein DIS24_g556 [Lasiodiplodia hormozganensis]|uniref:Uncharacterized protein n=1 Tax=Lasiodiplodia hormozganensis TaxID=869390 RepID=A0AA40D617_9PEZI|nr:hypothetical protein DIS24_g556 [Lasiodiplodia hormozganensis]
MSILLLRTTRLRADAVCPVISTPHVMGIMASNQHGSISTATTALSHDIPSALAPMASKTISSTVDASDSTNSNDSCDSTISNDSTINNESTVSNESVASNESGASNDNNDSIASSDSVTSNESTTSNVSATSSVSNALITPIKPRCFPIITIHTPAFVAPRHALRYIAAGWRVIFVRPARAIAMTASKLFGALVPGHANYKVANVDANGSLRSSVHRYGDLNEIGPAAASEVVQKAVVQEAIIQEAVVHETAIHETATQETVIQEAVVHETVIQEAVIQETVFQETVIQEDVIQEEETVSQETTIQEQETVVQEVSGGSNNKLPAAKFTFSFPAPNHSQPTATADESYVYPSFASNSLFGGNKLDAVGFKFTTPMVAATHSPAAGAKLPIAIPTAEFTFTAPLARRNTQHSNSPDTDSCWDGIFSPTSHSSESSMSSPIAEEKKSERNNNKKGGKKNCNKKKKKEPTNKAAVWGCKKGKKGSNKAKKH